MRMNRTWMQVIVFSIILVIGIVTVIFNLQASDDNDMPEVGDKPPAFSLYGLDDQKHELAEWSGKLIVLNFWGTFCPPCRNEMPALQEQFDKWNEQGVTVVGVSVDKNKVTVDNFISQYGISFPILLDMDEQVRSSYSIMYYPTTFFILPNGEVGHVQVGEMTSSFIESKIKQLLAK
jgi:peroxiredoxin